MEVKRASTCKTSITYNIYLSIQQNHILWLKTKHAERVCIIEINSKLMEININGAHDLKHGLLLCYAFSITRLNSIHCSISAFEL